MNELVKLGIVDAVEGLRKKQFSATELCSAFINRIGDDKNNTFITKTFDLALAGAKKADAEIASGNFKPLLGVPLTIKDVYCTKDIRTTCGSRMLENFVPPYESVVTQNLWDAGAIMLGKTNMDEFSMGSANMTSYFGPCINSLRDSTNPEKDLVPGGSSGGSAVTVADNLCCASFGGDTGGSVRQPASFCGIVGLRPTYGRCSRYGMIAYVSSLDQAGILGKNVADTAYLLDIVSGSDKKKDSTLLQEGATKCFSNVNGLNDV